MLILSHLSILKFLPGDDKNNEGGSYFILGKILYAYTTVHFYLFIFWYIQMFQGLSLLPFLTEKSNRPQTSELIWIKYCCCCDILGQPLILMANKIFCLNLTNWQIAFCYRHVTHQRVCLSITSSWESVWMCGDVQIGLRTVPHDLC